MRALPRPGPTARQAPARTARRRAAPARRAGERRHEAGARQSGQQSSSSWRCAGQTQRSASIQSARRCSSRPAARSASKQARQTGCDRANVGAQGGPWLENQNFWAFGAPPRERQARRALWIDAAGLRPRQDARARRRDVVDRNVARLACGACGEGADQTGRVEPVAASDPPEPGREQFVAIGSRRDRKAVPGHHPAARSAASPPRRPAGCVIDTSGRMRSSPKL